MLILHIMQARSDSSRLPGKIFEKIGDKSLLEWHMQNTSTNIYGHDIKHVITVPYLDSRKDEVKNIAKANNVIFRSNQTTPRDVLKEFVLIAKEFNPDWVVRTTCDCMMDYSIFLNTIRAAIDFNINIHNTYNEGSCTEVFKYSDLLRADSELPPKEECNEYQSQCREHVTKYFLKGFKKGSIDTPEDLERARKEYEQRN